jgi:hypothetical protein
MKFQFRQLLSTKYNGVLRRMAFSVGLIETLMTFFSAKWIQGGVALVSMIDRIIGLFCKIDL